MFNDLYKNKRVLVTGHTGFKGSWLTMWLHNLGAKIAGYSIDIPTDPSHFDELNLINKIDHNIGDIRDYKKLYKVCENFKPEIIFHMAAQPLVRESYEIPKETFEVNCVGTLNILEVIRNLKDVVKVGVLITSDKAYKNVEWVHGYRENDLLGGEDPYSGSKGAAELVAYSYMKSFFKKKSYPNIATVRAGNVIGGGDWAKDRIVPDIIKNWSKNKPVLIRNIKSTRPWQHVLEPLSGYLNLGEKLYKINSKYKNHSFNFGPDSDVNKTVDELINEMQKYWKNNSGWNHEPIETQKKESILLKLSCDKANIFLGWYPVLTFQDTIRFTSLWYENFYQNFNTEELTIKQIIEFCKIARKKSIKWAI